MSRMRRTFGVLSLFVVATACASPNPATTDGTAKESKAAAPVVPSPPGIAASPIVPGPAATKPPAIATSEAAPKKGRDHRSAVACSTDTDCGWDNECVPKRCVEAPTEVVGCETSSPPPGTCSCLEGMCTTKPKTPPATSGTCEIRGCMVDRAAGACVADTDGVPENIRPSVPVNVGPSCDCPNPAKGCAFSWFDAVPCTTDRDCWIDPSPRKHPVLRPKALRKRDFKPCKDGETAPKCGPAGVCVIGPGYTC